ncbi:hypothetical protein TNCV_2438251 [Trichonephila clavipes]|nr:hypothetical protein TNCV_2438251 [Trichonephila clavipes]
MKFPYGISHACGTRMMMPAHKSAQPCTFLAQTFDTRIIDYGGQEVAEATGGVFVVGLDLINVFLYLYIHSSPVWSDEVRADQISETFQFKRSPILEADYHGYVPSPVQDSKMC